jgi:hypothetical protein
MRVDTGSPLPAYRVRATRSEIEPSNLIYEDEPARHYGYRGGLVPGTSIYAYMSHCLVEMFGSDWLERGTAEVRLLNPIYDGEEVRVTGQVSAIDIDGTACVEYQAESNLGVICAAGSAKLPTRSPVPEPALDSYPAGKQKSAQEISLQSLEPGQALAPLISEFTWKLQWEYCQKNIRDHLPVYNGVVHPGWLLTQANRILTANYHLPAWIHAASSVQHFHAQREECRVEARGLVAEKYEHQGNHLMVLDLALFVDARCLQTIRHTVIFRIAPRAA